MKKFCKSHIILCLFFSTICLQASVEKAFYIDDLPYKNQANKWVRTYIVDYNDTLLLYPKELQMIINLIYFSFKRSWATIEGQSIAMETLDTIWKGWQNVAQTRLDPSKTTPYIIDNYEKQYGAQRFWDAHDQHIIIGNTYSWAVNTIVHGDFLYTAQAKNAVTALRNQGRSVVAQAIVDVRQYVGELFHTANKKSVTKAIPFIDYLWDYLPKLAINSFVEANNTNDLVSQKSWNILMKMQGVGTHTWQMIEQERAGFYLAFYKTIWTTMNKLLLEKDYFKIMFDEHGEILLENQYRFLPDPHTLPV